MNEHIVEIGLIKEKIYVEIKCLKEDKYRERLEKKITKENTYELLKDTLRSLKNYIQKQRELHTMTQKDYCDYTRVQLERSIKELEKQGRGIDFEAWKKHGKKMCDCIRKIKTISVYEKKIS